jgi:hypothetical protein
VKNNQGMTVDSMAKHQILGDNATNLSFCDMKDIYRLSYFSLVRDVKVQGPRQETTTKQIGCATK